MTEPQASPRRDAADGAVLWIALALAAIAAVAYAAMLQRAWPYTVDDAFIWFRYAQNLAAGNGITFNPEGPRAEGYTGFLWLWVMAIPHRLGSDPIAFSKFVGTALGLATFALTARIAMRLSAGDGRALRFFAAAVALLVLAASHTVPVHSVSGMETILYAFTLLAIFQLELSFRQRPCTATLWALPFAALAVGLSRPEGVLAACIVLAAVFWNAPAGWRPRVARAAVVAFVVPGAVYFAWRFRYYGVPLPLTFYVTTLTHSETTGLEKFVEFARETGLATGILFAAGAAAAFGRIPGSLVAVVTLALFYIVPTHRIPHQSRYFFPVLPLVCAVAGYGAVRIVRAAADRFGAEGTRHRFRAGAAAAIALALLFVHRTALSPDGIGATAGGLVYYTRLFEARHVALGKALAEITRDFDRRPVLAIGDAGAVPYYSGWHAIDSFGLNDPHIALTGDHDPAYILEQSPDLVIVRAWRGKPFNPMFAWGQAHYDACIAAGMEPIRIFGPAPYALVVMGDPDSEIAARLRAYRRPEARHP